MTGARPSNTEFTAAQKEQMRNKNGSLFDATINGVRSFYDTTEPPYYDESGRFRKHYKEWKPEDIRALEEPPLRALYALATADDYERLKKILPDHYQYMGGVEAFDRDITEAAEMRGIRYPASALLQPARHSALSGLITTVTLTDPSPQEASLQALGAVLRGKRHIA